MVAATSVADGDRRQRDEPDAIGVRANQIGGDLEGEAGFAGAAGTGQGDEAGVALREEPD